MKKDQGKASKTGPKKPSPKTGKIGWKTLLLVFFFSGWSFLIGILVGRGTAPVHFDMEALESEMASLKSSLLQKPAASSQEGGEDEISRNKLGFYENLKDTKPRISLLKDLPQEPAAAESPRKEAEIAPRPVKEKKVRAAESTVASAPAASVARPAPVPAGGVTIQVASLKDVKAADEMVARLKRKGYPAYRVSAEISGRGTWYRVRVGSFADAAQAGATLAGLKGEKMDGFLVKVE